MSNEYADIHSVHCYVHMSPHNHGFACHSTCPTCGGKRYVAPPANSEDPS